jgi:hypothetical protein
MPFTLWADDECLGPISLKRQEDAAHELYGYFTAAPPHDTRLRKVAVDIPGVSSWMLRDVRLRNGAPAVNPLLLGSEFFSLISSRVEDQSRQLAIELRDASGQVVPTALIVVQSTTFGEAWMPLYREAAARWEAKHEGEGEEPEPWINPFSAHDLEAFLASNDKRGAFDKPIQIVSVDVDDEGFIVTTRTYAKPAPLPPFEVHVRLIDAASVPDDAPAPEDFGEYEETVEHVGATDALQFDDGDAWKHER